MTVREGADPFHVDKDVVFRTTYYFRVFDYCVAKRLKRQDGFDHVVVPMTDSLYRFRMTGKAKSQISKVKFESGTLMAWEIDPFGARVEYDPASSRTRVISPREVAADARRAALKRDIYEMLGMIRRLQDNNGNKAEEAGGANAGNDGPQSQIERLRDSARITLATELRGKLERFARLDSGPTDGDANYAKPVPVARPLSDVERVKLLKGEVEKVVAATIPTASPQVVRKIVAKGFGTGPKTLDVSDPSRPGFVERATVITLTNAANLDASVLGNQAHSTLSEFWPNGRSAVRAEIEKSMRTVHTRLAWSEQYLRPLLTAASPTQSIQCPDEAPVRRGFQVLGPEGWRTFDQDERLLLAMSSSARPLTSTLKELSNRVLNARGNPSAELLPIVLEQKRLSEAERELETKRTKTGETPKSLADSVCKRLLKGEDENGGACDDT